MKLKNAVIAIISGTIFILALIFLCSRLIVSDETPVSVKAPQMKPYLCGVTGNSTWVLMESASTSTVTVEYGTSNLYGSTATTTNIQKSPDAKPTAYVHNIKLTGLQPGTRYYYRVKQGTAVSAGYSFKTAVNPGSSFRFVFMSDSRSGVSKFEDIAKRIKAFNPDFVLYGGDLCSTPDYSCFENEWFIDENFDLISGAPVFLSPGNHEGWGDNTKAFFQGPGNYDTNDPDFYSFDYGDLHIDMVNTELPSGKGSAQYNWLENDISKSTKPWKIAFEHKPIYTAGGYDTNNDLISLCSDVFEKFGVNMVLAGHSHFYQHNLINGIHHMIVGSAAVETTSPGQAPFTIKSKQDNCFAVIDVSPRLLNFTAYDDTGAVIENVKLNK